MNPIELAELLNHGRLNTYGAHGDPVEADCVLAFSFGYIWTGEGVLPGLSNEDLARYIEKSLPGLPIIAQFEVADALQLRRAELVVRRHHIEGAYLDSYEVAQQAKEYMLTKGWKSVVVVTHPAMEARNDSLCAALGLETVAPTGLEVIRYDPHSAQDWTREAALWWRREEGVITSSSERGLLRRPRY